MEIEHYQLLEFLTIALKIILAYVSGKLLAHIITGGQHLKYENILIIAALLPVLLMILILEIRGLYYFEYFLIGIMALILGILIGRRSVKRVELPIAPVFLMVLIGILLGLGYYGIALLGIFIGLLTFWKYDKKIKNR
jgi:hypothetical protein